MGATANVKSTGIYIEDKRQQKNSLLLKDVKYRIWAKLVFIPVSERPKAAFAKHKPGADENPMKYYQMFERRAEQGQCFTQPYLGTREFSASFRLVNPDKDELCPALSAEQGGNRDLGIMLYDMDFSNPKDIQAMFYRADVPRVAPHAGAWIETATGTVIEWKIGKQSLKRKRRCKARRIY